MARSRPSCSTSTRRFRDELNPRALTLKSFTPLWTTSAPGTACRASGACPVIDVLWRTSCGTTEIAAGASTIRSGARDAPSTTSSVSATATGSSAASTVSAAFGRDVDRGLDWAIAQPPEDDRLRSCGYPPQRVLAVRRRNRAETSAFHGHRDARQRRTLAAPGNGAGDGPGLLRDGQTEA